MSHATDLERPPRRRRTQVLFSIALVLIALGAALSFGASSRPVGEGQSVGAASATADAQANGITRSVPAPSETAAPEPAQRDRPTRPAIPFTETRGSGADAEPTPTATPSAPAVPEPETPTELPGLASRTLADTFVTPEAGGDPMHLPLAALSPDAAHLAERAGTVGVAVIVADGTVYAEGGLTPFPLASLVKLPLMLTMLEHAAAEARALSDEERDLTESMIRVSDNEATSALWDEVGGGAAMAAYLRSAGIEGVGPASNDEWGDTQGTPVGIARLLMAIAQGELPHPEHGEVVLNVLADVIDEHRWGVSSGFRPGPGARALLLKNGWFPAEDGWWVNSAGVVVADDGSPRYALAVLTRGRPSYEHGRLLIEVMSAEIHAAMRVR